MRTTTHRQGQERDREERPQRAQTVKHKRETQVTEYKQSQFRPTETQLEKIRVVITG